MRVCAHIVLLLWVLARFFDLRSQGSLRALQHHEVLQVRCDTEQACTMVPELYLYGQVKSGAWVHDGSSSDRS